jgi:vitamin-K-epoxide reductase (warfarin-sensitive)
MVMRILVSVLALGGLFVSVRALQVHNMPADAAPPCAVDEHWDCGAVNHSRFAEFPPKMFDEVAGKKHVPVAVFGIIGYSLMFVFAALGRWWITLQLAEIGFAAACMLSYIEAFVLEKWCIYCVWSQSLVTALLLATILALALNRSAKAKTP